MDFQPTERQQYWQGRVRDFIEKKVRPAVPTYGEQDAQGDRWKVIQVVEDLKKEAKDAGIWNLFMPPRNESHHHVDDSYEFEGPGLTNLEYALVRRRDGARRLRIRSVQLLRARYRQYGGAAPLRHERAEGQVADPADEWRDSLRLPDDGAAGRISPMRRISNAPSARMATNTL